MTHRTAGFTIVEIMVVMAILGALALVVVASSIPGRDKAKETAAIALISELELAVRMYRATTGVNPPGTCRSLCAPDDDPLMNDLGVTGWSGPYFSLSGQAHPWGGQLGITDGFDINGDGVLDFLIVLDDDRPGYSDSDNGGQIPVASMQWIDAELDDGDLTTGSVIGGSIPAADGEMMIKI